MAESMVETIARAMHESVKTGTPVEPFHGAYIDEWGDMDPAHPSLALIDGVVDLNELARAVLEALKTPTEGMKQAGAGEMIWYDREWDSAEDFFENAFEAAIQAALNEGEGK